MIYALGTQALNVHVRPLDKFGKSEPPTLLEGHSSQIQDLCFSPFYDNILATASFDGNLRIWNISDEDAVNGKKGSEAVLKGHTKKVNRAIWHPTAEFTMASISWDKTLKVWDVNNQACGYSVDLADVPYPFSFNYDGSMIANVCRNKKLYTIDPRQKTTAQEGNGLDTSKI